MARRPRASTTIVPPNEILSKNDMLHEVWRLSTLSPPAGASWYCRHIPTTRFLYGETFVNSSLKYFQNIRSAEMSSSKSLSNKGGVPLSSHTQNGILPYWVRYNIDFKRQNEIKNFSMLSQKHRENYKDKTGTVQPVSYFVMQ